ncbi:chondroitinase-B domain-containing protein [Flavisolibacter ginsenosidimutans]|uniref:Coagulation factor 5/8 type domain-containing protein n=1 Tax=Flavisolibacter ginsenosidimutans TaxID=661481 RepID=A0A5B8UI16_9BACT|nr:chondroitinase-B domain-containing protein [Flavisolibacter ginsenosidimutans]QEC55809.1 coagulation factor 5/8 type domain-containing protein [Flavisolibacter ginsenosidimutans]
MIQVLAWLLLLACGKKTIPDETTPTTNTTTVERTVHVSTSSELKAALLDAKPGDDIVMAEGVYAGRFVIEATAAGTVAKPIVLRGSRNAVLDAGSIQTGYVLYLQGSYWNLKGFTITNGLKGLIMDGSQHSVIDDLKIFSIGEEALHLRKFSSNNTVQNCEIMQTGLKTPDYGEGIYIGSAKNNWSTYTNGDPDKCDSNKILSNTLGPSVAAECIDVKEGTTAGIIRGNNFDATGITGANSADSWIDVKGNGYLIENNTGTNPGGSIFKDGYQVHVAVSGWGNNNAFKNNNCTVNAAGYGFNIQLSGSNGTSSGNKVYSNNTVTGAASGVSNISLSN